MIIKIKQLTDSKLDQLMDAALNTKLLRMWWRVNWTRMDHNHDTIYINIDYIDTRIFCGDYERKHRRVLTAAVSQQLQRDGLAVKNYNIKIY